MNLTTLDKLKSYLGKTSADLDPLLTWLIEAASAWFETQTGKTFVEGEPIPADVEQCVIEIAALRFKSREIGKNGDTGAFLPVFQTPASIQTVIDAHRKIVI